MSKDMGEISQRKKEHIEISLSGNASFKTKTTGFEHYDFIHDAVTEVRPSDINFETTFFNKKINYPFFISCMTGGTLEAESINARLSEAANTLNIPLGVGSQRQALESNEYHYTYKVIRQKAPSIPVLGNIGAAQIVKMNSLDPIKFLIDLVGADSMVIHVNPAQELLQDKGEPDFKGLLKKIEQLSCAIDIPLIVKEVGSGISASAAKKLIDAGVKGIDVAGAGGTSWSGIEILRNNNKDTDFWDWGLPTSYCIKKAYELKSSHEFLLIGSGGINSAMDAAKAFALGADITASARVILQELFISDIQGVLNLVTGWFNTIRKVMFLTGSGSLNEFRKNKICKREDLF